MQCSDLERYLEAYLDGRLGRSRASILRRHFAYCDGCRAKLHSLRQFERVIEASIGAPGEARSSSWQGLEQDLTMRAASGGLAAPLTLLTPPPRRLNPSPPPQATAEPRRPSSGGILAERRWSKLMGVLALTLALGGILEFARAWIMQATTERPAEVYRDFLAGTRHLAISTPDAAVLAGWFGRQLGTAFPVPAAPSGFELSGGDGVALPGGEAAVIVYAPVDAEQAGPAILFVQAGLRGEAAPAEAGPYHQQHWLKAPFEYLLLSADASPLPELATP